MDLKKIEKLMIAMGRNGMKRFVIKREGLELELERDSGQDVANASFHENRIFTGFSQERTIPNDLPTRSDEITSEKIGDCIESPLVGTFYGSPSPDAPPFVKPGDVVTEDTVVCIVEAMKVMNEVKAGVSGRIVEVLMSSGDPVQYGSKLFLIVKDEG